MYKQCLIALSAVSLALGLSLSPRGAWKDPAYSVPTSTLEGALSCPNGIKGKAGGIVFLVHGTGQHDQLIIDASPSFQADARGYLLQEQLPRIHGKLGLII